MAMADWIQCQQQSLTEMDYIRQSLEIPTDLHLWDCKISLKHLLEGHKAFTKHLARGLSGDTKITEGQLLPPLHVRSEPIDLCSQDFTHPFIQLILLNFVQMLHNNS